MKFSNQKTLAFAVKTMLRALMTAGSLFTTGAQATLINGYTLNITSGSHTASSCTPSTAGCNGSFFVMELSANFFVPTDIVGHAGMTLGTTQPTGSSHTGAPTGTEAISTSIDNAWSFFTNTGLDFTTVATSVLSASGNNATVNLSGWTVTWNGIAAIPMNSRSWNGGGWTGNVDSVAQITCAAGCLHGDTYTLQYTATVPHGDPSNFGDVSYGLLLRGTISAPKPIFTSAPPINIATSVGTAKTWTSSVGDPNAVCTATTPTGGVGTVALTSCSGGTFTPSANGTGTFTITADNSVSGSSNSTSATVSVTVANTYPPTAVDDNAGITNGTTPINNINLVSNDLPGAVTGVAKSVDATSVVIASTNHGTVTNNGNGTVNYTANAGFSGTDTFTYTVKDTAGQTSNAATVSVTVRATQSSSGSGTLTPGTTAVANGSTTGGGLTTSQVGADSALSQQCMGGCFDIKVTGLTAGSTINVVLPLSADIPSNATYRKLVNGTWQDFSTASGNTIASAAVVSSGVCPEAGSSSYTAGLSPGNRCVQLTIKDGGANDDDGLANGTVLDPGGIGVKAAALDLRQGSTGGCSLSTDSISFKERGDWMLLLGFIVWLGAIVRRKQNNV